MKSLWRASAPLVLASKSAARGALLSAAGIPFKVIAADIDERAIEAPLIAQGASFDSIAAQLARAKALKVSAKEPQRLVVAADQILTLGDEIFSKPANHAAAKAQLLKLAGHTHTLLSALCIARGGDVLLETAAAATLTCRPFDADFVEYYLDVAGDAVLDCVGAYQIEGLGAHLFEKIDGDHSTILGLPLLPLLAFLRQEGSLAA